METKKHGNLQSDEDVTGIVNEDANAEGADTKEAEHEDDGEEDGNDEGDEGLAEHEGDTQQFVKITMTKLGMTPHLRLSYWRLL